MYRNLPLLLLLLLSCTNESPIEKAAWVVGTWENHTSRGIIYETWTRSAPQAFTGKSYRLDGADTILLETTTILEKEDTVWFLPVVIGQNDGRAVAFGLSAQTDSSLVFENATHDFPQIITYRKVGTDSLLVEISGVNNGRQTKRSFPMQRQGS